MNPLPSCPHFELIYTIQFPKPLLLHLLFHDPLESGRHLWLSPFESAESAFPLADFCLYEKAAPSVIGRRSTDARPLRETALTPPTPLTFFSISPSAAAAAVFSFPPFLPSPLPPPLVTCYYTAVVVSARRSRAKRGSRCSPSLCISASEIEFLQCIIKTDSHSINGGGLIFATPSSLYLSFSLPLSLSPSLSLSLSLFHFSCRRETITRSL